MNSLFAPDDDFIRRIHEQVTHLFEINAQSEAPQAASLELLSRHHIATIIETAFWASLQSNEGRPTRVCLAVASPDALNDAVAFCPALPCDEFQIAKLAPAVPHDGCLALRTSPVGIFIWGFGRSQPVETLALIIDIAQPGTLRIGIGPFQPFAVLNGQSSQIIESTRMKLAGYLKRIMKRVVPSNDYHEISALWHECLALRNLAQIILAEGHGGTLLVVPSDHPQAPWRKSLNPYPFQFEQPDRTIPDGIRRESKMNQDQVKLIQQLTHAKISDDLLTRVTEQTLQLNQFRPKYSERDVRAIATLAAVDGAVVITQDMSVLGFGAKINLADAAAPRVYLQKSDPGTHEATPVPLESLGGTRHQSAARFVVAHPEAFAIVLSQDHHLSVMHWDDSKSALAVVRDL